MGRKKHKQGKGPQKQILADHKREGKVFLPPFLTEIGKLSPVRWFDDILPEIVWIALLFDRFAERRAVEVTLKCAHETNRVIAPEKARSFAFISEYHGITADQAVKIKEALVKEGALDDLQSGLMSLVSLYAECPFTFLFDDRARERFNVDLESSLSLMKRVVQNCLDRRGRPAMLVQATAIYVMMAVGKLYIQKGSILENIEGIMGYPDTEESRKVASIVRATMNAIKVEERTFDWCSYFWRHGYDISVCVFPKEDPLMAEVSGTEDKLKELLQLTVQYREELIKEVQDRWIRIRINLSSPMKDEVLGGLIARQARLATAIAINPHLWSVDMARILLRCMVDTYITLVWLAQKGTERDFEEFVEYGLGQEKLLLEHLTARLDELDPNSAILRKEIEGMRSWINSQLMTDFLPVNVGSWTKKSVREMAEETDSLAIYNLSYTPFSSVVHGMWNAIAKINLKFCINPLHRLHRVPSLEEPPIYLEAVKHAAQIMEESFRAWELAKGVEPLESTAGDRLRRAIEKWIGNT
jgi:hypothetical protein